MLDRLDAMLQKLDNTIRNTIADADKFLSKDKLIPCTRTCSKCGSDKTHVVKSGKWAGYANWRTVDKAKGLYQCTKCYHSSEEYHRKRKAILLAYRKRKAVEIKAK
jgi:hypothetical protein